MLNFHAPVGCRLLSQSVAAITMLVSSGALAQLPPQGSPIPRILPPAPPTLAPGAPSIPPPAPEHPVPAISVAVKRVIVEGSTAYPAERLSALTQGLAGPAVPLASIEAARVAILNQYRSDGYVLTAVSARVDADGTLRFIVTEGRIADVKLDGDIGPAGSLVLRFLEHLTQVRPIDADTLERWLLLAQDVPGVTMRAVLRPSTDEPGALTVVAQVERKPVSGLFTADNVAYRLTGPQEALLVLDVNSFTELGEKTELSYYRSSGNTQNFGQASSEFFVGSSGLRMRIYGGYGTSIPSGFLRDIDYLGRTTVAGLSLSYPLIRQRRQTLSLSAYFDVIDSRISTNTLAEAAVVPTGLNASNDELRILRIGADYARQDLLFGGDRSGVNSVSLRLSQGLPIFGASTSFGVGSRAGEQVSYFKANVELSRTQTLFEPWPDANVALVGTLAAQASGNVLPPVEKFYLGGLHYNPGYYSGEVTGDSVLVGSAELQLNTGFDASPFGWPVSIGTQVFGFYDYGQAWQNTNQEPNGWLASTGGGLRLTLSQYAELDLLGVYRIQRRPIGTGPTVPPLKADAFYWRALFRF